MAQLNYDYDAQEARRFRADLQRAEEGSLAERRAARDEWKRDLLNPALIAQRIGWLIEGNYGYGAHKAAREVLASSTRMNKPAWLGITIAAIEWQCPNAFARQAWNALSPADKTALTLAITQVITDYENEQKEEAAQ